MGRSTFADESFLVEEVQTTGGWNTIRWLLRDWKHLYENEHRRILHLIDQITKLSEKSPSMLIDVSKSSRSYREISEASYPTQVSTTRASQEWKNTGPVTWFSSSSEETVSFTDERDLRSLFVIIFLRKKRISCCCCYGCSIDSRSHFHFSKSSQPSQVIITSVSHRLPRRDNISYLFLWFICWRLFPIWLIN